MNWFAEFSTLDRGFAISAMLGAVLLVLRLTLMLAGAGDGGDLDVGDDVGFDGADATDASFQILSMQGLMAFFLMFGLVGLALSREAQLGGLIAFTGAMAAGIGAMVMIGLVYLFFERMQSSGNLSMRSAIGMEGTVYLGIPARGTGQIQVSIQGQLRVEDAVAEDERPLPTGTPVRVTGLRGSSTLVVTPLHGPAPDSTSPSTSTSATKE
jgi:membrane protein implicated in regulation of membrane protease activity